MLSLLVSKSCDHVGGRRVWFSLIKNIRRRFPKLKIKIKTYPEETYPQVDPTSQMGYK